MNPAPPVACKAGQECERGVFYTCDQSAVLLEGIRWRRKWRIKGSGSVFYLGFAGVPMFGLLWGPASRGSAVEGVVFSEC